jgi:DNA (cytosine-5)-methyltransferase 1
MADMKVLDLFAGVGGVKQGFEQAGFTTAMSMDFDRYCKQTFDYNYPEPMVCDDVTCWSPEDYPEFNILTGGFPCQAFSVAGQRKGFAETRGTLFFELARILDKRRPRAFLFENVKGLVSHDNGNTLQTIENTLSDLGYSYDYKVLNSWDFGVPQNRERIYIVGFRDWREAADFKFPEQQDHSGNIWEILDEQVEDRYDVKGPFNHYNSEEYMDIEPGYVYQKRFNYVRRHSNERRSPTLVTGMTPTIIRDGDRVRKLTPAECFRVQGFKDFKLPDISETQLYKQAGNSVSVPVIKALADNMWKVLS